MGLEPLDNSALPGEAAGASAPHPWLRSYPPGLDWSEPVQREPLFLALDRAVAEYSALPCLDFLGRIYSYAEVGGLVPRTPTGLQDSGVVQGPRVTLFLQNKPSYVICDIAFLTPSGTVMTENPH